MTTMTLTDLIAELGARGFALERHATAATWVLTGPDGQRDSHSSPWRLVLDTLSRLHQRLSAHWADRAPRTLLITLPEDAYAELEHCAAGILACRLRERRSERLRAGAARETAHGTD